MNVQIKVIPHDSQRYETCGDWIFEDNGSLSIYVSEMRDWRSEMLVALHELVEVILCKAKGISQESVDAFDKANLASDDPGDEHDAPYRDEHCFATAAERMVCAALGMAWQEHDDNVMKLGAVADL